MTDAIKAEIERVLGKFKNRMEDRAVGSAEEQVVNKGTSVFGMRSDMQLLGRNMKALSSKASDIKVAVERAEQSGREERKSEVKYWLEEVEKLENDFIALEKRAKAKKVWKRFSIGDQVREMEDQVAALTDQSQHFDGLLLVNI